MDKVKSLMLRVNKKVRMQEKTIITSKTDKREIKTKMKIQIRNSIAKISMKKMIQPKETVSLMKIMMADQFKTYRRVLFTIGKMVKYTLWASFATFWYHMYLLKKTDKPEQGFLANDLFLQMARKADWHFYDLKLLLTRPPVEKLLPDRPPLPPGAAYPKTLVVSMRGTLIHSEYKVTI
jgi:hypothetical protein